MMTRLRLWLDSLRTSLWFVPALMVLGAVILAYALLGIDASMPQQWWTHSELGWVNRLMDVRIRGATAMLQTIGSSIITIAGVVFSITIAAITLAAGQYTSRVLREFVRDRANQVVLGSFLGIFVYCMLILRSLSGASAADYAPPIALLVALALAFAGIAALIFFIHHIVRGLQATNVVAAIATGALSSIDAHYPERTAPRPEDSVDLKRPDTSHQALVRARASGYVTGIDFDSLVDVGKACDGLIRVRRSVGCFVAAGEAIAELQSADEIKDDMIERVRDVWSFSTQRTLANDPGYGVRQLVDVALKALSPGVNETTTGVMCVNWLGVMLLRMAERRFPPQLRISDQHIRVITNEPRFGDMIALGFDQIRQNASGNTAIMQRQLEVLLSLANSPGGRVATQPILRQADAIEALAGNSIAWSPDREPLYALLATIRKTLGIKPESDGEK